MDFSDLFQSITPNNLAIALATFFGVFLATLLQKKFAPKTEEEKKAAAEAKQAKKSKAATAKLMKTEAATAKAKEKAELEATKLINMQGGKN